MNGEPRLAVPSAVLRQGPDRLPASGERDWVNTRHDTPPDGTSHAKLSISDSNLAPPVFRERLHAVGQEVGAETGGGEGLRLANPLVQLGDRCT